jgi:hypothetical protein
LGGRGDAATAPAEADYDVDAATGSSAKRPANVGESSRAGAASSTRAANCGVAEETLG